MSVIDFTMFRKMYNMLLLPEEKKRTKTFFFYILTAYIFGVIVRLTALVQANQINAFWLDGKPVSIWTPDAGRYGYYAKMILEGHNLPFSADYLTGHLIAWVSELSGASVEWVMFLLPVFIAPLIVLPIMMIAQYMKQETLGFLVSLIAVSEIYLYVRTHLGYMDTDGTNLFLILLAIAFIIHAVSQKKIYYAVLASIVLQLFSVWYHSSSVINLLIIGTTLFVVLVYYRKEMVSPQIIFLLAFVIIPLPVELKFIGSLSLGAVFILLNRYAAVSSRVYWTVLAVGIVMVVFMVDPNHYFHRALSYLSPNNQIVFSGNGINYSYTNDLLTVSEVKGSFLWKTGAPFFLTDYYVIAGMIGYLLFLIAYPLMWFTLPLFILGLMSSFAGARFSMYATPVVAFGAVYILYLFKQFFVKKYGESVYAIRFPYYMTVLILLMMIYNLLNINMSIMLRTNIYAPEAKELKTLSAKLTQNDVMVSWWDYGWPLWYYTGNSNTLVDNGKHGGPDTYIIARMLLSTDQNYTYNAAKILSDNRKKAKAEGYKFVVPFLAKEYNLTELFSASLAAKKLPIEKDDGNIYIILHYKMLNFLNVINMFSKKDFYGKILGKPSMFHITELLKPFSENYSLLEGYTYILDSSDGTVLDAKEKKTPVKGLTIVQNNTRTKGYMFDHNDTNASSQVIAYRNKFIWLDQKMYDSFYIQAMLFDAYDHQLFEKVGETSRIKIFRLKKKKE